MAFAQLTRREGLRDIETCFNARSETFYHLGFGEPVVKSTLADATEQRDWLLWEDLAKDLIRKARTLCAGEDLGLELENTVYALESTRIDLCRRRSFRGPTSARPRPESSCPPPT